MSGQAEPFTQLTRQAEASFAEAVAMIADEAKPDAESRALANDSAICALDRITLLVRRLSATREYRARAAGDAAAPTPIVSDPVFRVGLEALAASVDSATGVVGATAGGRIVKALRAWLTDSAPEKLLRVGAVAEAAALYLRKRRTVPAI